MDGVSVAQRHCGRATVLNGVSLDDQFLHAVRLHSIFFVCCTYLDVFI